MAQLKQEDILHYISEKVLVRADSGYQGLDSQYANVLLPKKKPRGKELSEKDKESNRAKSRFRVRVEHSIAGIKRLGVCKDIYRNKTAGLSDQFMLLGAGIWNFHLATR